MNHVLIVGGGPVSREQLQNELAKNVDLLLSADAGGAYIYHLGITPHVLIGDCDSLDLQILDVFARNGAQIIKFPAHKDETDMELALDYALEQGANRVTILGVLGGRYDHMVSAIGLLSKERAHGVEIHMVDEAHDIFTVTHKATIERRLGWGISLIPLTDKVRGISTSGLLYPLCRDDLYRATSKGVHNQFLQETASIEVQEGVLLVVLFKE